MKVLTDVLILRDGQGLCTMQVCQTSASLQYGKGDGEVSPHYDGHALQDRQVFLAS